MKVKRLEDERERSSKPDGGHDEKPDLEIITKVDRSENHDKERADEPEINFLERVAVKSVSDEESDRDNQSVNESNSTGPKREIQNSGLEKPDKAPPEPDKSGSKKPDPVSSQSKPAGGEDSCNESSDSIAKGLGLEPEAKQRNKKTEERDSSELRDSVSGSKRLVEEEGTKESSDVQSSASLTRRGRRKCGGGAGEEPEAETASAAAKKQISEKSQPLVGVMELIRSHVRGSLFERRLESQVNLNFSNSKKRLKKVTYKLYSDMDRNLTCLIYYTCHD